MSSRVPAPVAQRVVDAVVLGDGAPHRRIAVLGVGDRGEAVAGHHTCTLRTSRLPDVGFWPGSSGGISSSATVHTARIGVPPGEKSVYLALTWVTNAGKP